MPGYNNYQNYGNYASYPGQNQYVNMTTAPQQPNYGYQQPVRDNRFQFVDYVSGRAGADAYQLPTGVNYAILFDNDYKRFFIKGYDNNGRPRVLEDNDYNPHVEPEPQSEHQNIDLSPYATKDDIKNMINDALSGFSIPNVNSLVTQKELDKALSELSVGNGGRIVRNNEHDA